MSQPWKQDTIYSKVSAKPLHDFWLSIYSSSPTLNFLKFCTCHKMAKISPDKLLGKTLVGSHRLTVVSVKMGWVLMVSLFPLVFRTTGKVWHGKMQGRLHILTYKKVPPQSPGGELKISWTPLAGSMLDPRLVILSYLIFPSFFSAFLFLQCFTNQNLLPFLPDSPTSAWTHSGFWDTAWRFQHCSVLLLWLSQSSVEELSVQGEAGALTNLV